MNKTGEMGTGFALELLEGESKNPSQNDEGRCAENWQRRWHWQEFQSAQIWKGTCIEPRFSLPHISLRKRNSQDPGVDTASCLNLTLSRHLDFLSPSPWNYGHSLIRGHWEKDLFIALPVNYKFPPILESCLYTEILIMLAILGFLSYSETNFLE